MERNAPGQRHNPVYVRPRWPVPLRYCDGRWTGHVVSPDQLTFNGSKVGETAYNGCLRLDLHEVISGVSIEGQGTVGRTVFFLGGNGYVEDLKYGHIWVADIKDSIAGQVVPSGGERGASAPLTDKTYRVKVTAIPGEMHYKTAPGSLWATYGNSGDRDGTGSPGVPYTYLLWSFLNNALGEINPGGGQVRALLRDGVSVHECDIPRIKGYSFDMTGRHNGYVWAAYVRIRSGDVYLYGWTVVAHQFETDARVWHLERIG